MFQYVAFWELIKLTYTVFSKNKNKKQNPEEKWKIGGVNIVPDRNSSIYTNTYNPGEGDNLTRPKLPKVVARSGVAVVVDAAEDAGAARTSSVLASPPRITLQDCRALRLGCGRSWTFSARETKPVLWWAWVRHREHWITIARATRRRGLPRLRSRDRRGLSTGG